MCKLLGTPTFESWSEWNEFVKFALLPQYPQQKILIEGVSEDALDLLNQMLTMNPLN